MKILPTREAVLPFAYEWVDLLARDRYEEAFDLLYHPTNEEWTPEIMRQLVANYGSLQPFHDGRTFRITPPSSAVLGADRTNTTQEICWCDEGERERRPQQAGFLDFDVPLNGQWSDLTLTFNVNEQPSGYVLELTGIHVL